MLGAKQIKELSVDEQESLNKQLEAQTKHIQAMDKEKAVMTQEMKAKDLDIKNIKEMMEQMKNKLQILMEKKKKHGWKLLRTTELVQQELVTKA